MFPKYLNPIEVHTIKELILGSTVAVIFWPIAIVLYCINVTLRFIAQRAYNIYHPGRYELAAGEDSVFGAKLPGSSKSYINGFKIIRGEPDVDLIRAKMHHVFAQTDGYDKLKHVLVGKYGYYCWDKKVPFDITKNIRLLDDFDPEEVVDEARITEICCSLVAKDCGENMPQWEILVIPKYRIPGELPDSKTSHFAIIIRLHHAYCDGISFVLLTNNFLADSPGVLPIDPTKGFKNPIWIKAYIWAKIIFVGPMNFLMHLGMLLLYPSLYRVDRYLNTKIVARSSLVEMETLRKIRLASGTSVTSITFAAVYAALYKTHMKLFPGKPVPQKLHLASVGVMLPYKEDKRLVNQFTMWPFTAPLQVNDPKERLTMAYEEVRRCASQPDPVFDFYMQRALGSLPKFLHTILFNLSGTPIMLSNVPGYKTRVKLFGGELVDAAAWIPLVTTTGIGLSTQSYCGKIHFSAVVDPQLFPTVAALQIFLEEIVHEIGVLAEAYEVKDNYEAEDFVAMLKNKKSRPKEEKSATNERQNDSQPTTGNELGEMQMKDCRNRKEDTNNNKGTNYSLGRVAEKVI